MTKVFNDPAQFTEDAVKGFCAAYPELVLRVPGGVVRRAQPDEPKVAVVVGGGSGHYPAFAGVVGPGFADGAVIGNVFTSPSAADAFSVGKNASSGKGVIITAGNYAGDVLHFTEAAKELSEIGIPAKTIFITDDVASAPVSEIHKRRGIAGDFTVFKTMSAASEAGYELDEVLRVGHKTNERTRTLGVAFSGCTLPGAKDPLFTVPKGFMGVGLGIHGEPGISEDKLPTAKELAKLLVDGATKELASSTDRRIAVILNGLGGTKYEELFVLFGHVVEFLEADGWQINEPEVGELVTSLEMAGVSLTITTLDDELEKFWKAPCTTPAYKKGAVVSGGSKSRSVIQDDATSSYQEAANQDEAELASQVLELLETAQQELVRIESQLALLDSFAGDGDHGRGMLKGINAAVSAAKAAKSKNANSAELLKAAGQAWEANAGGTSGALWGVTLKTIASELPNSTGEDFASRAAKAVNRAEQAVRELGKAKVGDKTMVDAFVPFVEQLERFVADGLGLSRAWLQAAQHSMQAAEATAQLAPKIGRARPLAEKSLGHPDPGAISFASIMIAVGQSLNDKKDSK